MSEIFDPVSLQSINPMIEKKEKSPLVRLNMIFNHLMLKDDMQEIVDFFDKNVQLYELNSSWIDSNGNKCGSLLSQVIKAKNINLLKTITNLPKYSSNENYFTNEDFIDNTTIYQMFLIGLAGEVRSGFLEAVKSNDLDLMKFYEKIQVEYDLGEREGLNERLVIKNTEQLRTPKYVLSSAFDLALKTPDISIEIVDFIISKKKEYGGQEFHITLKDMLKPLEENSLHYEKADYIREYLGYNYNDELFKKLYKKVKSDSLVNLSMQWLILENNIAYTKDIESLIKGSTKIENLFLYRKLNSVTQIKQSCSKVKI